MTIIGNNIAAINGKKESVIDVINSIKPTVVLLQETKVYKSGSFKLNNYCTFESLRDSNEGGGLMTIIHESLNPVQIPVSRKSKMSVNFLVVEADFGKERIRYINCYGVQECAPSDEKIDFISILDEEIQLSEDLGKLICIELDGNGKFGPNVINGDPYPMSGNGHLLIDLMQRKNLILVNGTSKCQGTITRQKMVGGRMEKSVLDYFLVCQTVFSFVQRMVIDEPRQYIFKKISKSKGQIKVTESDHNILMLDINCEWIKSSVKERTEVFNYRNKESQNKFTSATSASTSLTDCLKGKSIVKGGKYWLKTLRNIIHSSFKKIRIKSDDKRVEKLSDEDLFARNRDRILGQIKEDRGRSKL